MPESSLLETTAEVSVAFAGFIGIFLVLATRDGKVAPRDSIAVRTIVVCSVAPVFYAVAPLLLQLLGVSEATTWRASSAITGGSGILITLYIVPQLRTVPASDRPGLFSTSNLVPWFLTVFALACHVLNAAAWPWAPSGGVYLLGVWAIVGIAGSSFAALIFRRVF